MAVKVLERGKRGYLDFSQMRRLVSTSAILTADRLMRRVAEITPAAEWAVVADEKTRKENDSAMVGLADHHSLPYSD